MTIRAHDHQVIMPIVRAVLVFMVNHKNLIIVNPTNLAAGANLLNERVTILMHLCKPALGVVFSKTRA